METNQEALITPNNGPCEECGKNRYLIECFNGNSTEKLCTVCAADAGYCISCGNYAAGTGAYDFGEYKGYCGNC